MAGSVDLEVKWENDHHEELNPGVGYIESVAGRVREVRDGKVPKNPLRANEQQSSRRRRAA